MLANYEKHHFEKGERLWLRRYQNISNVLHWHFETEIIRIIWGNAHIRIGEHCFDAKTGDVFFCAGEELHYIVSDKGAKTEVMVLSEDIAKDITDKYTLLSPKLNDTALINQCFESIKNELADKKQFYCETTENTARGMIIDIFRNNETVKEKRGSQFYKNLITKINDEFAFITFEDAAGFLGYSPSHFSKMFKRLSGRTFSEYLNIIKVENAIMLLRSGNSPTMTEVSLKCGFSTIRNFNRVFKQITGYSPHTLPKDFIIDTGLRISKTDDFDPTEKSSAIIK